MAKDRAADGGEFAHFPAHWRPRARNLMTRFRGIAREDVIRAMEVAGGDGHEAAALISRRLQELQQQQEQQGLFPAASPSPPAEGPAPAQTQHHVDPAAEPPLQQEPPVEEPPPPPPALSPKHQPEPQPQPQPQQDDAPQQQQQQETGGQQPSASPESADPTVSPQEAAPTPTVGSDCETAASGAPLAQQKQKRPRPQPPAPPQLRLREPRLTLRRWLLYEGKSRDGEWWPICLTKFHAEDGTYSARVSDGQRGSDGGEGSYWPVVLERNVRPAPQMRVGDQFRLLCNIELDKAPPVRRGTLVTMVAGPPYRARGEVCTVRTPTGDEFAVFANEVLPLKRDRGDRGRRESSALSVRVPGVVGLTNLGNTCYLNSGIQCLANCPRLREYFLSKDVEADLNTVNPLGARGQIAAEFTALCRQMWLRSATDYGGVVNPNGLRQQIMRFNSRFGGSSQSLQHDAQELVYCLLDGLHEDTNRAPPSRQQRPSPPAQGAAPAAPSGAAPAEEAAADAAPLPDAAAAQRAWEQHLARNDSKVVELFHGQLRSQVTCGNCRRSVSTFDPFSQLALPVILDASRYGVVSATFLPAQPDEAPCVLSLRLPLQSAVSGLLREAARLLQLPRQRLALCYLSACSGPLRLAREDASVAALHRGGCSMQIVELPIAPEPAGGEAEPPMLEKRPTTRQRPPARRGSTLRRLLGCFTGASSECDPPPAPTQHCFLIVQHLEWSGARWLMSGSPTVARVSADASNSDLYWAVWDSLPAPSRTTPADRDPRPADNFCLHVCGAGRGSIMAGAVPGDLPRAMRAAAKALGKNANRIVTLEARWEHPQPLRLRQRPQAVVHELSQQAHELQRRALQQTRLSLADCIARHNEPEELDEDHGRKCPHCKQSGSATRDISLWRTPAYLCLQLKRFSYLRGGDCGSATKRKVTTPVDYPLQGLDLSPFMASSVGPCEYDLCAVACHTGTASYGHYTAYAKSSADGKWYEFDDAHVAAAQGDAVRTAQAYLLFYERRDGAVAHCGAPAAGAEAKQPPAEAGTGASPPAAQPGADPPPAEEAAEEAPAAPTPPGEQAAADSGAAQPGDGNEDTAVSTADVAFC